MKTILMIIGILLAISSCQCFKIKKDIRRVWSFKFNECRCQTYDFEEIKNLDDLIPCEDYFQRIRDRYIENCQDDRYRRKWPERCINLQNYEYCDDLVGFSSKSWALNITPKARESKACFEDTQNKLGACK